MMARLVGHACIGALLFASFACSRTRIEFAPAKEAAEEPTGSFVNDDAGSSTEAGVDLIAYCPSSTCTNHTTTCPTSRFACDVDLMSDDDNCGACGFKCPGTTSIGGFRCAAGKCVMTCDTGQADCNGILEDGCETRLDSSNNCGACGNVCSDPAKPCVDGQCGCPGSQTWCNGTCRDMTTDDRNCGTCGNTCDPAGDGSPTQTNTYFGCYASQCDQLKCTSGYSDCDGKPENGCETSLTTTANCGGCGITCAAGEFCGEDDDGSLQCLCKGDKTRCGDTCKDLATDPNNCGACGVGCSSLTNVGTPHGLGYCAYGSCAFECTLGWGDCNGDLNDGCETHVRSDPSNCGGCGIRCDIEAGQACIGGRCAVEPCETQVVTQ